MLRVTEYDALLKVAVEELRIVFPSLHLAELTHAVARANLDLCARETRPSTDRFEHTRSVMTLARRDLEQITGRRGIPVPEEAFAPKNLLRRSREARARGLQLPVRHADDLE